MIIDNFSIGELSIAFVSVIGSIAICLRGSRCSQIKTPCCEIEREVLEKQDETEDNLNNT